MISGTIVPHDLLCPKWNTAVETTGGTTNHEKHGNGIESGIDLRLARVHKKNDTAGGAIRFYNILRAKILIRSTVHV